MAKSKRTRTAAQKRATAKMLAANRARRGSHTKRYPARKAANTVAGYFPNPAKRYRKRAKARSAVVRRRRNPIALRGIAGNVTAMFMPSLQGAGGALLVNTLLNYMPFMPAALKSGNGKYLARAGMAVAVGVFGKNILPGKVASNMAVGALTVALHDLLLGIASQAMPTLQLGDVGDYDDGVSAYIQDSMAGVGGDVYEQNQVGEYINA